MSDNSEMQPPVLTEAGVLKAQRNRTIFNRAIAVIQKEFQMTREDALNWLSKDDDPAWVENENSE